jgi:hypothetical protein
VVFHFCSLRMHDRKSAMHATMSMSGGLACYGHGLPLQLLQRTITGSKNRQRDTSIQRLGCGGSTFRNSIPLVLTRLSGAHAALLASAFWLPRLSQTPNRSIPNRHQLPLGRFLLSVVTWSGWG